MINDIYIVEAEGDLGDIWSIGGMSIYGVGCKIRDKELCWAFYVGGEKEMKVRCLKKSL